MGLLPGAAGCQAGLCCSSSASLLHRLPCLSMIKKQHGHLDLRKQMTAKPRHAAGRVYSKRVQGKLVFYDIKADGEKVQVMADVASSGGDLSAFVALHNSVKIGDLVGVSGFPGTVACPLAPCLLQCQPAPHPTQIPFLQRASLRRRRLCVCGNIGDTVGILSFQLLAVCATSISRCDMLSLVPPTSRFAISWGQCHADRWLALSHKIPSMRLCHLQESRRRESCHCSLRPSRSCRPAYTCCPCGD